MTPLEQNWKGDNVMGSGTWLSGWAKRIKLDLDYTNKIGASVSWFPVTIFLKAGNGDTTKVFNEVGANYKKIAVTKADAISELKVEVEWWDSIAQVGVLHCSKSDWTINADTSIYIYYDNTHADNPNVGDKGSAAGQAVWDNYFTAVWHLDEATGAARNDSKGSNNLTNYNNAAQIDGKVGKATNFIAANKTYLRIADNAAVSMGDIDFTIELRFKIASETGDYQNPFRKDNASGNREYMFTRIKAGAANAKKIIYGIPAGTTGTTSVTYEVGTWYDVVFYHDATNDVMGVRTNVDTLDTKAISGGFPDKAAPFVMGIGLYAGGKEYFDGIIDEFRISKNIVRSLAWIKGTYNTLWDALLTYGSEKTRTPGIVTLFNKGFN